MFVGKTRNQHPHCASSFIVILSLIPSLPNLVSQILVNQQSLDVDFGERGLRIACESPPVC